MPIEIKYLILSLALLVFLFLIRKAYLLLIKLHLLEEKAERYSHLENELKNKEELLLKYQQEIATLQERCHYLKEAQNELATTFKALSYETLEQTQRSFLGIALGQFEQLQEKAKGEFAQKSQAIDQIVQPVNEALKKLEKDLDGLEKQRQADHINMHNQVKHLMETERELKTQTLQLVQALKGPISRGRWGEMQLKRIVELAGLVNHCDFIEQAQGVDGEDQLRPDLVIKLSGGRNIVIDAKAPLDSFLDALETDDHEIKKTKLQEHARQVRLHVSKLSKKSYWQSFQPTPEFVVMFLPAETFFSAALEQDPSLIELSATQGVILATPTTLIALLKTVAFGWKQEQLSEHAERIKELGQELYKRLYDMTGSFSKLGRHLTQAVDTYNQTLGSFESRVLVTGRKFKELGASHAEVELEALAPIEKIPRNTIE